ncbi:RNA polymerase sigma factor [Lederbergia sp. NSJ-179]|uniref:RNA polymerase sigma factor n=1 Tax=Lederbergia sp. NSJ-179 TaxID=2931402 RepID=UPI001FCFABD1|nr:RNA polymerase sigma factor [Lederbergia sp. NSJ-179]MCJ7840049.1 RNA polymerase sigma factor [Lederbergia sp. NSJ-179]
MSKENNQQPITQADDDEKLIFEMHYHEVYKVVYFIIQDRYLAEDLTQEAFIKAFQNLHKLKSGTKMKAWLVTIATRTAIDHIRKVKKRNDYLTDDVYILDRNSNRNCSGSPVEGKVEKRMLKQLIKRCISVLNPPAYKEVLLLKFEYDLKEEEIAEVLNISPSAVKSRLHRAKKKLRKELQNYDEFRDGDHFE